MAGELGNYSRTQAAPVTVRWLTGAIEGLKKLREYIAADHPEAAGAIARRIIDASSALESFPAIGPVGRVMGRRELLVGGTEDLIVYRAGSQAVDVLRIFRGAQKWPGRIE